MDVFTETPFTGNQLAVIQVTGELEKQLYEKISSEFGYSESSFAYYSVEDRALKIRSFTSTGFEIHGGGHNLLGVVSDFLEKGEDIFAGQAGEPYVIMKDTPTYLELNNSSGTHVIGMKQRPASFGDVVPVEKVAEGLSLNMADFSSELPPVVAATEVSHLMVPVKSTEVLDKIQSNKKRLSDLSIRYGFEGVYCFSLTGSNTHLVETRFFNPLIGIDEDPATGSAAGPLAGLLYKTGRIKAGTSYQLLQGSIMKRPSIIKFQIADDGIVISGSSVVTMEGKIFI
nr:PhzF family phenazine biosynthesis protein [Pedobacter mongoliensis]